VRGSDRVRKVVVASLKGLMKAAGFKKSGLRFYRRHGSTTQVLEVQLSHGSSFSSARFYVNVGVSVDLPQKREAPATDKLKSHECDWSSRLEELAEGAPARWELDEGSDLDQLCARLHSAVETALETLAAIDSADALMASGLLDQGARRQVRAQILYAQGDDHGALAELRYLESFFSNRKGMSVPELVARLGMTRLEATAS
jgi:Domain of unknown function (DUF4304)